MLVQLGVVEGVGLWRRAILRPSERSGDLFSGLATALLRDDALPELAGDGTTIEQLAGMLRAAPEAASHLIKGALSQAASNLCKAETSPVQPGARLVLVLDQLEELYTAGDLKPDDRAAFFGAIRSLAESGQTWVIATLRSDFYHRCAEIPALVELKAGLGEYDLQPPDPSEIAQLVRRPAFAAGLRFEEELQTGDRLDDLLRDAAAAHRDSLPLLEFTLDELYRRRSGNVLTLQAYRELGSIEGALARRADEVFAGLPDAAKAALPHVFRQLVTIGNDAGGTAARKQAPWPCSTRRKPAADGSPGGRRRDVVRAAAGRGLHRRAAADRQTHRRRNAGGGNRARGDSQPLATAGSTGSATTASCCGFAAASAPPPRDGSRRAGRPTSSSKPASRWTRACNCNAPAFR